MWEPTPRERERLGDMLGKSETPPGQAAAHPCLPKSGAYVIQIPQADAPEVTEGNRLCDVTQPSWRWPGSCCFRSGLLDSVTVQGFEFCGQGEINSASHFIFSQILFLNMVVLPRLNSGGRGWGFSTSRPKWWGGAPAATEEPGSRVGWCGQAPHLTLWTFPSLHSYAVVSSVKPFEAASSTNSPFLSCRERKTEMFLLLLNLEVIFQATNFSKNS